MVDENRTFFITEHVHFHPRTKEVLFCPPLLARIEQVIDKGFKRSEIFLKLFPDGTLDFSDAMHLFWKEGSDGSHIHG